MKIIYEIKTLADFKKIPVISKVGVCISFISVFVGLLIGLILVLDVQTGKLEVKGDYFFYCLGVAFLGLLTAILFDKDRKKKTKIGIKGPN